MASVFRAMEMLGRRFRFFCVLGGLQDLGVEGLGILRL